MKESFKPNKPLELFGHAMRLIHFTTEGKNLQDFSTRVFEAAGKDIQEDINNGYTTSTTTSTKHLDEFLTDYAINKLQLQEQEIQKKFVQEMKANLTKDNNYDTLKNNLKYVRVQGVGKSIPEKAAAAAGIAFRTAVTGVAAGFAVVAGGLALWAGEKAVESYSDLLKGDWVNSIVANYQSEALNTGAQVATAMGAGAGFLGMSSSYNLNQQRENAKEALRSVAGINKWRPVSSLFTNVDSNSPKISNIKDTIQTQSTRGNPKKNGGRSFF